MEGKSCILFKVDQLAMVCFNGSFKVSCPDLRSAPPAGIDSEVADFFASSNKVIVIDEATNVRLRWMVHKRVLVRCVRK
jgi:hypothetical protein